MKYKQNSFKSVQISESEHAKILDIQNMLYETSGQRNTMSSVFTMAVNSLYRAVKTSKDATDALRELYGASPYEVLQDDRHDA